MAVNRELVKRKLAEVELMSSSYQLVELATIVVVRSKDSVCKVLAANLT